MRGDGAEDAVVAIAFASLGAVGYLTYRLGTNPSPYAALAADLPAPHASFSEVVFRASASRPVRMRSP